MAPRGRATQQSPDTRNTDVDVTAGLEFKLFGPGLHLHKHFVYASNKYAKIKYALA